MKAFPSVKKVKVYAGKFGVIDEKEEIKEGMDLRDYFAAKAMQGILANNAKSEVFSKKALAIVSYEIADNMIKERKL